MRRRIRGRSQAIEKLFQLGGKHVVDLDSWELGRPLALAVWVLVLVTLAERIALLRPRFLAELIWLSRLGRTFTRAGLVALSRAFYLIG